MNRLFLRAVLWFNRKAKRLAIRLVKWTGKSREAVHPKHLLGDESYWYMVHVRKGDVVLDVGCGHGAHAHRMAKVAARVEAIDKDRQSIAAALRTGDTRGRTMFWTVDVERGLTLFPHDAFDVVLCLDLLEHVVSRDHLLAEMRRVLKRDGRLLLAVPNRASSWKRRLERAGLDSRSDPDHKVEYTLPELEAELARAGFVIMAQTLSVADTPLIGCIDILGGLSLPPYRQLTEWRKRRAARYPEENAGFQVVCRRTN